MKVVLSLLLIIFSHSLSAKQCDVTIERDVQANDGWLLFHLDDGTHVEINDESEVLIGGDVVELTPEQLQAVQQYRQSVAHHMDRLSDYATTNAKFLEDMIDDIAVSLGSPNAFDELKEDLERFWGEMSESHLKHESVVLPAGTFDSFREAWQSHTEKAKALFDTKFIGQVWQVFSSKIKKEGEISLSVMGKLLVELENNVSERIETHSNNMSLKESDMCDELHGIADKENVLRDQIPELQDYRVFTI